MSKWPLEEDAGQLLQYSRLAWPAPDSQLFSLIQKQVGQEAMPQPRLWKAPWNHRWQFTKLELLYQSQGKSPGERASWPDQRCKGERTSKWESLGWESPQEKNCSKSPKTPDCFQMRIWKRLTDVHSPPKIVQQMMPMWVDLGVKAEVTSADAPINYFIKLNIRKEKGREEGKKKRGREGRKRKVKLKCFH